MPAETQSKPEREVSAEDKRLASDWLKRIDAAKDRHKEAFKQFAVNRKLLAGKVPGEDQKKIRTNLYFVGLATMRPQVYAKDPEYSVSPTKAVPEAQLPAVEKFAEAAETVLTEMLVRRAKLKQRAKRALTSAYTTSIAWLKMPWQGDDPQDPLLENRIKSLQDNLQELRAQREKLADPSACGDLDLQMAKLQQTLAGLEQGRQAEVPISRGIVLDWCMSEDVIIVDPSVRELGQYERAEALAQRVYMTRAQYTKRFGYETKKGKAYSEVAGQRTSEGSSVSSTKPDPREELLCVWEIWDQSSNRVLHVCDGEEGFCRPPFTPDWTGKRWYPFFALAFNEIDGTFYPLSDVELTQPLVEEYNTSRDDLVKDRRDARPTTIVRKGGSLTPDDVKNIRNRDGNDVVLVEGAGNEPLSNDIQTLSFGQINPAVYDTTPARTDIEQILGSGDANRGTVMKAKTATEAEILAQGLRGRSAERQDTMEDLLSEMGEYALQMCLRKLTPEEVADIAGPEAAQSWPVLSAEQVFNQVTVHVRGGSTGKPDRLQEQDRWTKLLPVIEKTMERVAQLRAEGQEPLARAVIELTRETLRRFDERLDLDQYLPPPKEGEDPGAPDPAQLQQMVEQAKALIQELQGQVQQLQQQLADKESERQAQLEQARIQAEASVTAVKEKALIDGQAAVEVARIQATGKVAEAAAAPPPEQPEPLEATGAE